MFCTIDGTNFLFTFRFLIVRSVPTRKKGGSGADFEEFTKLCSEDLMSKMKTLALIRGFIIVVYLRFTSRSKYQASSFMISWTKYPKFQVSIFGWWSESIKD